LRAVAGSSGAKGGVSAEYCHTPERHAAALWVRWKRKCGLDGPNMNRNDLYLVIGVLALAALVPGYLFYQEKQKTYGITIDVGKNSISIETK
jgi:hypothetical protein